MSTCLAAHSVIIKKDKKQGNAKGKEVQKPKEEKKAAPKKREKIKKERKRK